MEKPGLPGFFTSVPWTWDSMCVKWEIPSRIEKGPFYMKPHDASHQSSIIRQSAGVVLALAFFYAGSACATADFFCAGKTRDGAIQLSGNSGHDGTVLLPPHANASLTIGGREIDLSGASIIKAGPWTIIQNQASRKPILSYRKMHRAPVFSKGVDYHFCSRKNWKGCWAAKVKYRSARGRTESVDAVCGEG
jgi:hypothetical protein